MVSKNLKAIAWALVVAVVLIVGTTTAEAFVHEVQHATHHSAGMHTTGICAWMCVSAGAVSTPVFLPVAATVVQPFVLPQASQLVSLIIAGRLQARAPPTLL
jgi:hypothetical protein